MGRNSPDLPKGLFRRSGVIQVSKTIKGTRHQFSLETNDTDLAIEKYNVFLAEHGLSPVRVLADARPILPKGLYWKGNVIWLSRSVNGKHFNLSTGTDEIDFATKFLEEFNLKAFKGEKLGVRHKRKRTFSELADLYLEQAKADGLRDKTDRRYASVRDSFQTFLKSQRMADADAAAIDTALVEAYKIWRSKMPIKRNGAPATEEDCDYRGCAPSTLRFELQTIGSFFRNAVRLRYLDENPLDRVRSVRVLEKVPVYLEEEEIVAILDAAASYESWGNMSKLPQSFLHALFFTYLKTGIRLQEARFLEWSDIDLSRRELRIRDEKQVHSKWHIPLSRTIVRRLSGVAGDVFDGKPPEERVALLGKKNVPAGCTPTFNKISLTEGCYSPSLTINWRPKSDSRTIPISAALAAFLGAMPQTSNLVFPDPRYGGLWRLKLLRLVNECAEQAAIQKNVHPHVFRHTFATQLRRRGVALETIQELLGHADLRDTLIYAQFTPEEAQSAIEHIDFF